MITIKVRFRSKELFAQGKLLLSGGLVFIMGPKEAHLEYGVINPSQMIMQTVLMKKIGSSLLMT